jgi:hypothetical protein
MHVKRCQKGYRKDKNGRCVRQSTLPKRSRYAPVKGRGRGRRKQRKHACAWVEAGTQVSDLLRLASTEIEFHLWMQG